MKRKILETIVIIIVLIGSISCTRQSSGKSVVPDDFTISKDKQKDKLKGGWAGQPKGCTYGGQTEFRYHGTNNQE